MGCTGPTGTAARYAAEAVSLSTCELSHCAGKRCTIGDVLLTDDGTCCDRVPAEKLRGVFEALLANPASRSLMRQLLKGAGMPFNEEAFEEQVKVRRDMGGWVDTHLMRHAGSAADQPTAGQPAGLWTKLVRRCINLRQTSS